MSKILTLPILFHTASTSSAANCEIEYKLKNCTVKEAFFAKIDVILPFEEDGVEYSQIFSSGQSFYSTLASGYILDMIDEANASEFVFFDN